MRQLERLRVLPRGEIGEVQHRQLALRGRRKPLGGARWHSSGPETSGPRVEEELRKFKSIQGSDGLVLAAAARAAWPLPPPGKPPQGKLQLFSFHAKNWSPAQLLQRKRRSCRVCMRCDDCAGAPFCTGKREFWRVFSRLQPFKPLNVETKEVKKPPEGNEAANRAGCVAAAPPGSIGRGAAVSIAAPSPVAKFGFFLLKRFEINT